MSIEEDSSYAAERARLLEKLLFWMRPGSLDCAGFLTHGDGTRKIEGGRYHDFLAHAMKVTKAICVMDEKHHQAHLRAEAEQQRIRSEKNESARRILGEDWCNEHFPEDKQ